MFVFMKNLIMLWDFKIKWSCVSKEMILCGSDFEMLQQFSWTMLFLDNKETIGALQNTILQKNLDN